MLTSPQEGTSSAIFEAAPFGGVSRETRIAPIRPFQKGRNGLAARKTKGLNGLASLLWILRLRTLRNGRSRKTFKMPPGTAVNALLRARGNTKKLWLLQAPSSSWTRTPAAPGLLLGWAGHSLHQKRHQLFFGANLWWFIPSPAVAASRAPTRSQSPWQQAGQAPNRALSSWRVTIWMMAMVAPL